MRFYDMLGGRMCVAEVSSLRSWSRQHVEWDHVSVSVIMTAREMLGSHGYKSLLFRTEQPALGPRTMPVFRFLLKVNCGCNILLISSVRSYFP